MGRRRDWKRYAALWLAMMALRQDGWLWDDARLVLGVLPAGLAYQLGYTLLAAGVIALCVRCDWPHELERLEAPPGVPQDERRGA